MEELTPGTRVDHERYGEGIVSKANLTNYDIVFHRGGLMQIAKSTDELEVLEVPEQAASGGGSGLSLAQVEEAITYILEKYGALQEVVELGDKWDGGTVLLQPANDDLKPKEIPMETFFHKIVMVRDRLRVLEQNINSHPKLNEEDKVHLQQYITRSYGSLTTFNVLFKDREDYFSGSGK
ncbi:MAG: hypothetical protein AAGB22_14280 [Bacteroidota bacterium]